MSRNNASPVMSFGCRLNAYESEVMEGHMRAAGMEGTVVINSCAVTAEAERQLRQSIRKLKREQPETRIIVTGCAAQIHPDHYADMPEVDAVVGNEEKLKPETYLALNGKAPEQTPILVNDIMSVTETALHMMDGMGSRTRAFMQVQNGCNHRCTFCIIPYGRGNSRSVPVSQVVSGARQLLEKGFREIVITGVDVSDYGKDLPETPTLGQLLKTLLEELPELPRLRLSSIDAVEVDEDLKRLFAENERLMPYLHVSLQAGDNLTLKRMKRRHLREDAIRFCNEMRSLRPEMMFGADIIAGFPTETEEMFQKSLDIVDECGLTYLHVFPYSERPGTPAAKMPSVPLAVRKERAARLRDKGQGRLSAYLNSLIGTEQQVLVEQHSMARNAQFAEFKLSGQVQPGEIITVVPTHTDGKHLFA
jgi:threonylcarbamoyladenosine tRNA methylthiotransferase MtaB